MKVLISGAGIAGPTLAYWLLHHGFEPTLLERAPQLRIGGYVVDFWGSGFDVAERMGLLPELGRYGYDVQEIRMVDHDGRSLAHVPTDAIRQATRGRFLSIPRGDLAAAIYRTIENRVETVFGDSIKHIEDRGDAVRVEFERSAPRAFDLVIGADGLHSRVRQLVFGEQERFEKHLGYGVAAFASEGYHPRDEQAYVLYTQVGQQVARFSMRDDRTMFLFVFADQHAALVEAGDVRLQKALIRRRFGDGDWECSRILDAMDASADFYFDRVSQIRMDRWTRGRVALVGDAASCVSLLAGQGSALAMVAAYVLAGELAVARGDHHVAFARYEERLGDFIASKQKAAEKFAWWFAPHSAWSLFARNQATRLLALPFVASLVLGRDLMDKFELPTYEHRA